MNNLINFLQLEHPEAESIKQAQDIDYINVVIIMGYSEFWNTKGEKFIIPMRKTVKYHKDTIRLKILTQHIAQICNQHNIPNV